MAHILTTARYSSSALKESNLARGVGAALVEKVKAGGEMHAAAGCAATEAVRARELRTAGKKFDGIPRVIANFPAEIIDALILRSFYHQYTLDELFQYDSITRL